MPGGVKLSPLLVSDSNWSETEHASLTTCRANVAATERIAHIIKPVGVFNRKVPRPTLICFDQFDIHLGHILPLVNQF